MARQAGRVYTFQDSLIFLEGIIMKTPSQALKQVERRSIAARTDYDRLRAATTQAQNAMVAMYGVAQSVTDPTLKAALEGYSQFSESMLRTLEKKLNELKGEINQCASEYAKAVYGVQLGDRLSASNVTTTKENTVIDIEEMGIDASVGEDGVHKQVYVSGPRIGKKGNVLKTSAWLMLGNPRVAVTKQ